MPACERVRKGLCQLTEELLWNLAPMVVVLILKKTSNNWFLFSLWCSQTTQSEGNLKQKEQFLTVFNTILLSNANWSCQSVAIIVLDTETNGVKTVTLKRFEVSIFASTFWNKGSSWSKTGISSQLMKMMLTNGQFSCKTPWTKKV